MATSNEIRHQFIDYFVDRHSHRFVGSSPVVPHDDPTLMFANAGMNQFKDVFLNTGTRDYTRAVNSQKCIRAGGKHNDLEDVGRDTYHHTFFEMLGNWSFGDYFKKEAIQWAWDLLTNVWAMDKSRLHATVFEGDATDGLDPDEEAAQLWTDVTDINPAHIHRCSKKDNFWEMGDTGPCGPCSEIHVDLTPDKSGSSLVNADDPRVIEIWNLVFIQYNRDASGKLSLLPAKHVDTGMGFERICAVLQGKTSNYDTDVFAPIFHAIQDVTGARPYLGKLNDQTDVAYRVIADHIRCLTFALTDGAAPSNEGRGYVLRRILRRAVRHGWQTLEVHKPFLHRLVPAVVETMGQAFPELKEQPDAVTDLIRDEEQSFAKTLDRGIALFEQAANCSSNAFLKSEKVHVANNDKRKQNLLDWSHKQLVDQGIQLPNYWNADGFNWNTYPLPGRPAISADDAFKLHDTFGFPLDLTQVMAEERGMAVDVDGFNRLMAQARQKSRGVTGHGDAKQSLIEIVQKERLPATRFAGYDRTEHQTQSPCHVYRLTDGAYEPTEAVEPGDQVAVVFDQTPFYAESGGQVGDTGSIEVHPLGRVRVEDTVKVGEVHFHLGLVEDGPVPGADEKATVVTCHVDRTRRDKIMANHTSTHLLNRALRDVLGDHVQQKGSLVDDAKLRFDFSHPSSVEGRQIDQIEQIVNRDIVADLPVHADEVPQEEALKINGLRAVFGEKYPRRVRVVSIGASVDELIEDPENDRWRELSIEFCGGTHLPSTGDAEGFVVISEEAVAKGVRRITALTGQAAHQAEAQGQMLLARLEGIRGGPPDQVATLLTQMTDKIAQTSVPSLARAEINEKVAQLQKLVKELEKQQSNAAAAAAVDAARALAEQSSGQLIVASIEAGDSTALRSAMDVIRKKQPDAALLLGAVTGEKVAFVASVPKPLIEKGLKAGDWVREAAKVAGGGGGGRPDMAQAGGKDPSKLANALDAAKEFAESKL